MKSIVKNPLLASLMLLMPAHINAQQHIIKAFDCFVNSPGASIKKEITVTKDPETGKKESECRIYQFEIEARQRFLINQLLNAFEEDDNQAYAMSSGDGKKNDRGWRNMPAVQLGVGKDNSRSVGLGSEGTEYIYSCFLDPDDNNREYRYAYGMEWKETEENITGKLVVTYALRADKRKKISLISINDQNLNFDLDELKNLGAIMDSLKPTLDSLDIEKELDKLDFHKHFEKEYKKKKAVMKEEIEKAKAQAKAKRKAKAAAKRNRN